MTVYTKSETVQVPFAPYLLDVRDPNGILMIEPTGRASVAPLVDRLTMRMAAAYRNSVPSDYSYRGWHECVCGARSGNKDQYVDGKLTNSLAVHYLAYHRKDVPQEELDKVAALPYGMVTPTEAELVPPPGSHMVIVEAPNVRLSSVTVSLVDYVKGLTHIVDDLAEYAARRDGEDYETVRDSYREDLRFFIEPTQRNAETIKVLVQQAAERAGVRSQVRVSVMPPTSLPDDPTVGAGAFNVEMAPHVGFTVFLDQASGKIEVEDVLEGGDEDFFTSPEQQKGYFDLVNELRKPNSTQRGKRLYLYTARPVSDHARYLNATSIPANIFLSSSADDALGLAVDLGGEREVWEVVVNSRYLVQTLNTPRVQHYQAVAETPIESIHLVSERTAKPRRLVYPPGRSKNLAPWNRYNVHKLTDDLLRTFYYTFRGYEGPHPWGIRAKPPLPEYRPLKVVDPQAGATYRVIIENHLKHPKVRQRFLRTLVELQMLLRGVDPSNPKLRTPRKVTVAARVLRSLIEE